MKKQRLLTMWEIERTVLRHASSLPLNDKLRVNWHYDITWTERATSVKVKSKKGEAIEVSFEKGEVKSFMLNIEN